MSTLPLPGLLYALAYEYALRTGGLKTVAKASPSRTGTVDPHDALVNLTLNFATTTSYIIVEILD
jgi:hypothetical protein